MCYTIGKIYIWQNIRGNAAGLNGQETTVIEGPIPGTLVGSDNIVLCWLTDTVCPLGRPVGAIAGQLRPKEPPSGERDVMNLFSKPQTDLIGEDDALRKIAEVVS